MRILGLDVGEKRIGVAISDPMGILASPLEIIKREDDISSIDRILVIIKQNQVGKVVVGIPYTMRGEFTGQARSTTEFAEKLKAKLDIEIIFRDERLSTVGARRLMTEANIKKRKQPALLDAAAAAIILQGYLDFSDITENKGNN